MRPILNPRRPGAAAVPTGTQMPLQQVVGRQAARVTISGPGRVGPLVSPSACSPDAVGQGRLVQSAAATPKATASRTVSPHGVPAASQMRAASLEQAGLMPRGGAAQPWLGCVEEEGIPAASGNVVTSQRHPRGSASRVHSGPAGPAMVNSARIDPAIRRVSTGTPGSMQVPPAAQQAPAGDKERLQFLREELAAFTGKMDEMRTAAVSLQEEVLRESLAEAKPMSASSGATTALHVGPSGQVSASETSSLNDSWVIETLKRTLLGERSQGANPAATAAPDKEIRLLRQEIRMEVEARRQLAARMDAAVALLQEEKKKREEAVRQREEADSKLEQKWHGIVKEEGSLRRAVESHLEARLGALQREMRLECGAASQQAQQVLSEFTHMRESLRKEMEINKMEIGSASSDLSRLVDQLRVGGGAAQPMAELPAGTESLTEGLVRAEVRRQLSERPSEPSSSSAPTVLELQALSGRIDRLEKSFENEAAGRQEDNSKMIDMFQEISKEARQHQDAIFTELEQRLQGKLEQLSGEVQEEVVQRRTLLAKESKDREETCMAILKSLEDQLGTVKESLRSHEMTLQHSLESTAAAFAEKNMKEMMTTRQDVLELREELQEVARNGRERLEEAVVRMNAAGPARGDAGLEVKAREELWTDLDQLRGELRVESATRKEDVQGVRSSLDRLREQVVGSSLAGVEELQGALQAERLAREQGDTRCMEALREALREDQQKLEKAQDAGGTPSVKDSASGPSPYADIKQVSTVPRPATTLAVARSPGGGYVLPWREGGTAASTAGNLATVKPASVSMTHPSFSA